MNSRAEIHHLLDEADALTHSLRSAGTTPSGFTAVRPGHVDPLLRVLARAADWLVSERPGGHDDAVERTLALCAAVLRDPAAQYETVRNRLRLIQGRLHVHRREWAAADSAIGPLVFRPHAACDDMGAVREAMLLDRFVRPNLVETLPGLAALFVERLLFLYSRHGAGSSHLDLLEDFAPQITLLLRMPGIADHVARVCGLPVEALTQLEPALDYMRTRRRSPERRWDPARLLFRLRRGKEFRALFKALHTASQTRTAFALSRASVGRTERLAPRHRTLVTRGMGGAGDIATMIPGLVALARKTGAPVHFAIPRALLPVASGFPEIVPLAVDEDIQFEAYETWFNFGECPAARAEVATAPFVTRGRIELFARAAGITPEDLDASGWTARFQLDARQQAIRDRLHDAARAQGRRLVGVAPFSRDEYKRAPALITAARQLAVEHEVIVLHSHQLPILDRAGLRIGDTPDLGALIAVIAACDYVISVDTAHVHLAGALGVPTLAIFGPTDGRLVVERYPHARLLQPRDSCPIMPCWRSEDLSCRISRGLDSVCLDRLAAADILAGFARMVEEAPCPAPVETDRALTAA